MFPEVAELPPPLDHSLNMPSSRVMAATLCLLMLSSLALHVAAWGPAGHNITALIAGSLVSVEAEAAVQRILGNRTLVDIINWADDVARDLYPWRCAAFRCFFFSVFSGVSPCASHRRLTAGNCITLTCVTMCPRRLTGTRDGRDGTGRGCHAA